MLDDAFNKFVKQNRRLMTMPTWDELCDILYVKSVGKTNMFINDDVMQSCMTFGLVNGAAWLKRLKEHNVPLTNVFIRALSYYVKIYGESSQWNLGNRQKRSQ